MATKTNPGQHDCYAKAEPDEPLFVLLARDKHAASLVWLWSVLREIDGEEPEKVREAQTCAAEMVAWCHDKGRQVSGLGVAGMAAVMELIRVANLRMSQPAKNTETDIDAVRGFFCRTLIEPVSAAIDHGATVPSRPECVFNYCPNMGGCPKQCQHPASK